MVCQINCPRDQQDPVDAGQSMLFLEGEIVIQWHGEPAPGRREEGQANQGDQGSWFALAQGDRHRVLEEQGVTGK